MNNASQNQLYEEASRLRDRVKSIKHVQKYQSAYIKDLRNIDIFGIYILNGRSCIFGMFYRNGTNYGNKAFFPSHDENANSFEILESFLFQFYSNKEPPLKVIINFNSKDFKDVQTILRDKYKNKIKIINPVKGEKFKHMKLAEKNAMENIKLKSSNIKIHHKLLLEIKKLLKLNQLPQRIEAYDNSHIFGMFYRNGTNYGNKAFFPSHDENANSFEILESFLFQFYSNKEPPLKIIINLNSKDFKEVQIILRNKYKSKIKIINPIKGEKFKHMKLAEKNAMENMKLKSNNIKIHHKLLLEIKKLLKLNQLPQRIEAYDNSHIFGKQSVGVMIVINQEGFETRGYRKFNIRYDKLEEKKSKSNDYYMLKEVLERRLVKLDNENEWINPDIIIIDGWKGHLNIAKNIIYKNRKNKIELIAIAKCKDRNSGREIIYYNNEYKILDKKD